MQSTSQLHVPKCPHALTCALRSCRTAADLQTLSVSLITSAEPFTQSHSRYLLYHHRHRRSKSQVGKIVKSRLWFSAYGSFSGCLRVGGGGGADPNLPNWLTKTTEN